MPFASTTDPDVQEALSRRYGNDLVIMLPLSSGNIAIFRRDFELQEILSDFDFDFVGASLYDAIKSRAEDFRAALWQKSKNAEAARFYGEPQDKDLARDLRRERQGPKILRQPKESGELLDL